MIRLSLVVFLASTPVAFSCPTYDSCHNDSGKVGIPTASVNSGSTSSSSPEISARVARVTAIVNAIQAKFQGKH